jgi:hypothetical protein
MGEVATIVAIAGGITSTGITGLVTWKVSKNSSSVELVKVAAENHRLQYGNQEEERRNRQATYHQFLDVIVFVFQILGVRADEAERKSLLDSYNHLLSGVLLFGDPSVRKGAYNLNTLYNAMLAAHEAEMASNPEKSDAECWQVATTQRADEFKACASKLVQLMHEDVTRGIA